ncbi:flavin-containing monooxygenase 5-like isoform X2 [Ptychodera flava]|uniref:flavin-containing monooxygenase 5-like isoform X2 n=1 Tax=Ptychodera flava TaxID=63121 RepID=UPI00396A6C27
MQETKATKPVTHTQVCVIGAGISGLVTAKCFKEANFDTVVLERTDEIGGLWTFREKISYGVMRCTHINVSKHNYCFSDFPFPDDVPDYPHHSHMAKYIVDYAQHFGVTDLIRFQTEAKKLEKKDDEWHVTTVKLEDDGKGGYISTDEELIIAKYVAIATGHHVTPSWAKFPGQESFKGEIIHGVDYKDPVTNRLVGSRVLVVGIGNSAVDVATDCASVGRCKAVHLSTRSGAWIVPNYIFGFPTDHYSCRAFLWLPWQFGNYVFEKVITLINGNPKRWNLNPKMKALQTQPTVSPTLIHMIQRGYIEIHSNISKISGKTVHFTDGSTAEVDHVIYCTGYSISLPFLSDDVRQKVLEEGSNRIKLYKNVFSPELDHTLSFIGFLQPASGGLLSMSETQARWQVELCKGKVKLPSKSAMLSGIKADQESCDKRYYASARHTIQKDPILYCDEVSSFFGAKPQIWRHPTLAWKLLFGTCGAAQYRLQGPHQWDKAYKTVKSLPVTDLIHYSAVLIIGVLFFFVMSIIFSLS